MLVEDYDYAVCGFGDDLYVPIYWNSLQWDEYQHARGLACILLAVACPELSRLRLSCNHENNFERPVYEGVEYMMRRVKVRSGETGASFFTHLRDIEIADRGGYENLALDAFTSFVPRSNIRRLEG